MTTLKVTGDGVQWPPVWVSGVDEVVSELFARLRAFLGEVPGDRTAGLPYRSWWQQQPTDSARVAAIRAQAEAVRNVTGSTVSIGTAGTTKSVNLTVTITIDGETTTRTLSTDVYDGVPGAWYLRVGGWS